MNRLIIEAGRGEKQYWRDLWRYRELFYFLAWRDLLIRYKQTVVGVAWSVIRPFLTMVVLTVVFGKFGKMPSGGVPYPILVFCGMLPWQFFSTALNRKFTIEKPPEPTPEPGEEADEKPPGTFVFARIRLPPDPSEQPTATLLRAIDRT